MKAMKRLLFAVCSSLTVLSMAACGGGGGSAPATGAAVSKGVITAKGSVFVNGIEYNTAGATIKIDDNPGVESDLKVGMIVTVKGPSDDATKKGTATQIEARDALEGTISAVGSNTITVMGQTVRIEDNVTRLSDDGTVKTFAAANFVAGERVEVHAFPDDQGGLRATKVAKKTTGEFEIKGFVKSIGTGTFVLSLTPGGADALTVTGTLPAGAVVGSIVEVKAGAAPVAGAVTATAVTLEDRLGVAGQKVEVEGIVSSGDVNSFVVNGQQVVTNAATLFEGGLKADFVVGIKVEAEGPLDANGAIVATKISFRSNIKIEADITAFTAGTSITLLGKTVAINSFTQVDPNVATSPRAEVQALLDVNGNLVATRIVGKGADSNQTAFFQGPVSNVNATAGTFSILDVAIATNTATKFELESDSSTEQLVSAATFFANLKNNVTVVKVRWRPFTLTSAAIEQAEIELGK